MLRTVCYAAARMNNAIELETILRRLDDLETTVAALVARINRKPARNTGPGTLEAALAVVSRLCNASNAAKKRWGWSSHLYMWDIATIKKHILAGTTPPPMRLCLYSVACNALAGRRAFGTPGAAKRAVEELVAAGKLRHCMLSEVRADVTRDSEVLVLCGEGDEVPETAPATVSVPVEKREVTPGTTARPESDAPWSISVG